MKYQMINKELQIASCSIADLTTKQAQQFLEQWGEDASLGTLTLFYDSKDDLLVLNRDNKLYQKYLEIAEQYLQLNKEQKIELRKVMPASLKETMDVIEYCSKKRICNKWIFRALKNHINDTERMLIEEVIRRENPTFSPYIAFRLGVIRGKRAERAKKKKH